MRAATAVILALLFLGGQAALAAPAKKGEFASSEAILRWINTYRAKPNPEKVPLAVRAMSNLGLFRDMETAGIYVGFIAGVLETNPKRAEALIAKMFPMPPEDQVAIVRAIAYSGLPDWKDLMLKFAERMPARKALIDRFVYGKQPTLKQVALDSGPAPLDTLWGQYFATGSFEPIARMVSILAWAKDQNNVERLTIGSMAKLSLATNASRDKDLLDMLKASMAYETKDTRAVLQEVIDAAETFEFGRVRKDAMASIDKLKAKGPASARNLQWWGMVGQTALAVGCVAAGAMGHLEVGIPCVVGGAASGAALKFMTPE
ncbi:MAG: hypothetical protein F9K29_15940 [Hyphomicrobiaceae bacterium]|nr:MAG: hypothetical protein F9K29_15940 [Hyphomicrobiaceae bacterium]